MKKFSINVDEEFHREVKIEATRQDTTIAEVVKQLLKKWLEESRRRGGGNDNGRTRSVGC